MSHWKTQNTNYSKFEKDLALVVQIDWSALPQCRDEMLRLFVAIENTKKHKVLIIQHFEGDLTLVVQIDMSALPQCGDKMLQLFFEIENTKY